MKKEEVLERISNELGGIKTALWVIVGILIGIAWFGF